MHPYLKQAIAQSHIDDLHRDAQRRRMVRRADAPAGRHRSLRQLVQPRVVAVGGILGVNGAHR